MDERRNTVRRQADREMLEQLEQESAHSQGKDRARKRRHAIRHHCTASLEIELPSSAGPSGKLSVSPQCIEARVLDLSEEGAALFTKHAMAIGQSFGLKITTDKGATIETVADVRWSKHKEHKNGYLSGVKFTHLAPEFHERIEAFLAELDNTLGL